MPNIAENIKPGNKRNGIIDLFGRLKLDSKNVLNRKFSSIWNSLLKIVDFDLIVLRK